MISNCLSTLDYSVNCNIQSELVITSNKLLTNGDLSDISLNVITKINVIFKIKLIVVIFGMDVCQIFSCKLFARILLMLTSKK